MIAPQAKRFLALVSLLCLSSFSHSLAQQNTVSLVFNVSVTDDKGRTYRGLKPENFSAWVDKAPRKIISLTADNQPASVGLCSMSRAVLDHRAHAKHKTSGENWAMVRPDF